MRLFWRKLGTLQWRASLVVGVVALRPLRPRRAGGPRHDRSLRHEACAPLCAARRLAARAVPPPRQVEKPIKEPQPPDKSGA